MFGNRRKGKIKETTKRTSTIDRKPKEMQRVRSLEE
jgi:hypothetical protein